MALHLGETSEWKWEGGEIPLGAVKVRCSLFCNDGHAHVPETSAQLSTHFPLQNQEMLTEGDLANSMDQTDKVRELQDKIARLRAQVSETRTSSTNRDECF